MDCACGGCKNPDERGFTLIEVLFAMTIFTIGVLALAGLQARYISGNAAARMQTEATALAAAYLERLRALPYAHPELRAAAVHRDRRGPYRVAWTVVENDLLSGTKTLHITVTPDRVRSGAAVRLSTVVARER